jgi:hypothetical protein
MVVGWWQLELRSGIASNGWIVLCAPCTYYMKQGKLDNQRFSKILPTSIYGHQLGVLNVD